MSVAENLQTLRKKHGITQEQLADELGVSRQAISKWETGEAFPETDKLIALCERFGVSCDTLLRGTVSEPDLPDRKDGKNEKRRIDRFSLMMAFGVGIILFGIAVCVLLCGFGKLYGNDLLNVFGGASVLLCVACSVFLFVYGGITNENFKKANPERQSVPAEDAEKFLRRFPLAMAALISGVMLLVVMLVLGFALFADGDTKQDELIGCIVATVFFAGLSVCVGGLCLMGIRREGYTAAGTRSEARADGERESTLKRLAGGISGAIMMTATVVFLLCGFLGDFWHPAWVVFPIGGILCGIVNCITDAIDKKK